MLTFVHSNFFVSIRREQIYFLFYYFLLVRLLTCTSYYCVLSFAITFLLFDHLFSNSFMFAQHFQYTLLYRFSWMFLGWFLITSSVFCAIKNAKLSDKGKPKTDPAVTGSDTNKPDANSSNTSTNGVPLSLILVPVLILLLVLIFLALLTFWCIRKKSKEKENEKEEQKQIKLTKNSSALFSGNKKTLKSSSISVRPKSVLEREPTFTRPKSFNLNLVKSKIWSDFHDEPPAVEEANSEPFLIKKVASGVNTSSSCSLTTTATLNSTKKTSKSKNKSKKKSKSSLTAKPKSKIVAADSNKGGSVRKSSSKSGK